MRTLLIGLILIVFSTATFSQENEKFKFESKIYSENTEITDILKFEGIQYVSLQFSSDQLYDKSFSITVKEIWDGELKNEKTIINTIDFPSENLKTIHDSILNFRVVAKLTEDSKLKMTFNFPFMSTTIKFDAIDSDNYSLRVIAKQKEIKFGEKFYLLTYMLPYEKDNYQYYCAVEQSGKDIVTWGKEFGIKHYLIFEMEIK